MLKLLAICANAPQPRLLVQTGTLSMPTVAQSQLLRPYPQYVGLNTANPAIAQNAASSIYHSLQLKVERRFSKGMNLLVSYTSSKLIDNASGRIFGINGNPPPELPRLDEGGGFSLDFWIKFDELSPGQTVFDARDEKGKGIAVVTSDRFTLKIVFGDSQHSADWDSDPGVHEGTLKVNAWQHVVVTVDGGPKIVTFIIDGALNDGGPVRQYDWSCLKPELSDVNGSPRSVLAKHLLGELKSFRVYDRYLRTSEAVGNFRAERP